MNGLPPIVDLLKSEYAVIQSLALTALQWATEDGQSVSFICFIAEYRYDMIAKFVMYNQKTAIYWDVVKYDTIRYDSVCLMCSKKLTGIQLSLPHGTHTKLKCKTKSKMMSVIGPVQSCYHEAVHIRYEQNVCRIRFNTSAAYENVKLTIKSTVSCHLSNYH